MGYYRLKIAIMQPTFNPWLGYFDLIDYVDKFIFLDTVQLKRRGWQVRNKIIANQEEFLFTLPIKKTTQRDDEIICKVQLAEHNKNKIKFYNLLKQNYKKARYFNEIIDFIESLVLFCSEFLSEYNINMITKISKKLNINTAISTLSKTDFCSNNSKGDMIFDICKFFGATSYISPLGSKTYLNETNSKFSNNNINIYYQYYNHPTYNQLNSNFMSHIGIIDLLFNEGFQKSQNIIKEGRLFENR